MKVYEFLYNPFIHESAACTVSIHLTLSGAYKAMRAHRVEKYNEWRREQVLSQYKSRSKEGWAEWWGIRQIEILP